MTRLGGEIRQARDSGSGFLPPRERSVFRHALLQNRKLSRKFFDQLAAVAITRADLDLFELGPAIELGDGQGVETVDPVRAAHHHAVEPTAAARSSRRGSVLVPPPADLFSHRTPHLGRQRTAAYPRDVRS